MKIILLLIGISLNAYSVQIELSDLDREEITEQLRAFGNLDLRLSDRDKQKLLKNYSTRLLSQKIILRQSEELLKHYIDSKNSYEVSPLGFCFDLGQMIEREKEAISLDNSLYALLYFFKGERASKLSLETLFLLRKGQRIGQELCFGSSFEKKELFSLVDFYFQTHLDLLNHYGILIDIADRANYYKGVF